ncbi:hypothetical protein [Actinomadura rudentiformis]|uniref:C2H2-type domain-containing protein n=1 Tax=Actinomadura rudentiformis TaxID=359158 RepID=A0A6H9YK86_9ACTN|nr:hypothetical protein [Actinomadura rudentiformis]KAB2344833.1 hypothetical protein F8566_30035 [Actinomadura rudentiformis]
MTKARIRLTPGRSRRNAAVLAATWALTQPDPHGELGHVLDALGLYTSRRRSTRHTANHPHIGETMTANTDTAAAQTPAAAIEAPEAIDGLRVIENEPAVSPLSKPGKPVYFQQIRELLLEDGSARFRCVHCPETSERLGKIRRHLSTHANPTTKVSTSKVSTSKVGKGKESKATPAEGQAAGTQVPATQETGTRTPVTTDNPLNTLTLAEITARLHEIQELDALRAKVVELTAECKELRAERDEYRAGHDELLAATRGVTGLRERAENAESALAALHTVLEKTAPTVQRIFDHYQHARR